MSDKTVKAWVRPEITTLSAYHVPDASGMTKLDAMENPHHWPDDLRQQWADLLSQTHVNRYPDPHATVLRGHLAESIGLQEDMQLLLGNGSDEIIQIIMMSIASPGRAILSIDPGFVMYRMIATFCGLTYIGVPLRADDFSLDLPAMLQAIEQHQPAVIFLAYPNNPTGNLFEASALQQIIQKAQGLVVIDEAYAPFTDASFLGQLGRYDNLLVMRTLSKMGLAGLRLGYLAGPSAWLNEFDKVRLPYNINVLTQVSADFALSNQRMFDAQTSAIRAERARLFLALSEMQGVHPFESEANFILVRMPEGRAEGLFACLKGAGILVKNLHGTHPMLADCLRITVGTAEENDQLLTCLHSCL